MTEYNAETGLVALRKESVDRNVCVGVRDSNVGVSLSARRAWIEISCLSSSTKNPVPSLSARRAWIEILSDGMENLS